MRISTGSIIFRAYFSKKSHTKNVPDEEHVLEKARF